MNGAPSANREIGAALAYLQETTGLVFRSEQRQSTEEGVRRTMARCGIDDAAQFALRLRTDRELLQKLTDELTIGETYFFREPEQFEFISRHILPAARQRVGSERPVRIWSAGCSSGEEAYTLAMLCAELGWSEAMVRIVATDVSQSALSKARAAVFRQWSLRGSALGRAAPYFVRTGDCYTLQSRIRDRVQFSAMNLAQPTYPNVANGTGDVDLILCRNVLIYFDRDTIQRVFQRLSEALAPGGWLVTASGDPHADQYCDLRSVVTKLGVFYQKPPLDINPGDVGAGVGERGAVNSDRDADHAIDCAIDRIDAALETFETASAPPSQRRDCGSLQGSRIAFAAGDYERAVALTAPCMSDPAAAAIHLRALANLNPTRAAASAASAVEHHPLSAELSYLQAVILMGLGRTMEAVRAAQRAIFLDRSLAVAHFTLASILDLHGSREAALRAYRNAQRLAAARPLNERLPLSENSETAGHLAAAAASRIAVLQPISRERS